MGLHQTEAETLRVGRLELTKLGYAFALSLALHLMFWGTYAIGKHFHWWDQVRWPQWVQKLVKPPLPPPQAQPPQPSKQPAMVFVDVNDLQSVLEPPKNATRYSDRNAVAANPELAADAPAPKLDGPEPDRQNTETVTQRKKTDQLMPDPPKPKTDAAADAPPKLAPGTMTVAKADLKPQPEMTRPRTLKDALRQKSQQPGQKAKLDGGAQQRPNASFDVKATGFGAYDRAFIDAVSSRWYDLLDSMSYESYRSGRVKVEFSLNYDGSITDVKVLENTVTSTLGLLCEKAIRDPAPFEKWPREMRLAVGEDSRRITFTFYYD